MTRTTTSDGFRESSHGSIGRFAETRDPQYRKATSGQISRRMDSAARLAATIAASGMPAVLYRRTVRATGDSARAPADSITAISPAVTANVAVAFIGKKVSLASSDQARRYAFLNETKEEETFLWNIGNVRAVAGSRPSRWFLGAMTQQCSFGSLHSECLTHRIRHVVCLVSFLKAYHHR